MLDTLIRNWWVIALRGLVALVLGVVMLVMPSTAAVGFLVMFIGAYAIVDGIFALAIAVVNTPPHKDRLWMIIEGTIGILAGIAIFIAPILAAVILLYIVAFWALMTGLFEMIWAVAQWKHMPDNWLMFLGGLFSTLLGILIFTNVAFGAAFVVVVTAVYLILFGVLLIALGFSFKNSEGMLSGDSGNTED
jgi:uncharacterized membrane protein HdeD (DUF308 family)